MNINININLSKKTIIITSICIVVIGFIFAIISFLNSNYYWNKIVLKKSLEVQNTFINSRFDLDSKMVFYPKQDKIYGKISFTYKDKQYFKNIKHYLEKLEPEENMFATISFKNCDGFEVRNEQVQLHLHQDGFGSEFHMTIDKKEIKEIKETTLFGCSTILNLDNRDYRLVQEMVQQ